MTKFPGTFTCLLNVNVGAGPLIVTGLPSLSSTGTVSTKSSGGGTPAFLAAINLAFNSGLLATSGFIIVLTLGIPVSTFLTSVIDPM